MDTANCEVYIWRKLAGHQRDVPVGGFPPVGFFLFMHILYLDEAGTHKEASHFVVAGLAVFERQTYHLARALDEIQTRYLPDVDDLIPFHASNLRAPDKGVSKPFDTLSNGQRKALMNDVYEVILESNARVFAVAMEKAAIEGDPYERGFEEIVSRFDQMVSRVSRERGEDHRGLIVVAESSYRDNLELLANKIARQGHRWGQTYNLADIPYFAPAKNTRLLQLADFVANAVYGRYEGGYTKQFDRIAPRIDQEQGRMYGLVHLARNRQDCYCPACVSRRVAS